jgi:hypothetical protein
MGGQRWWSSAIVGGWRRWSWVDGVGPGRSWPGKRERERRCILCGGRTWADDAEIPCLWMNLDLMEVGKNMGKNFCCE